MNGFGFLRCIIGFFFGVLAYQIYDSLHLKISRWSASLELCVALFLAAFLSLKQNPQWDYTVLPFFALLVIAVATSPLERGGGNFKRAEFNPVAMVGQGFLFNIHGSSPHLDFCGSGVRVCAKEINSKRPRRSVKFLAGFCFCFDRDPLGADRFPIYASMGRGCLPKEIPQFRSEQIYALSI
jgi:hypothetical protein